MKEYQYEFSLSFAAPRQEVWPFIADTARINEASGIPAQQIREVVQSDGSVRFFASARIAGLTVEWEDLPQNWVMGHWFSHRREFVNSPIAMLEAKFFLEPVSESSCDVRVIIRARPRNWLGYLLLRGGFLGKTRSLFRQSAVRIDRYLTRQTSDPFETPPPKLTAAARARIEDLANEIDATSYGHGLGRRIAEYITTAGDLDVAVIRPLGLARHWGVGEREAIEACLQATKSGLLGMRWELLCPRCQGGKSPVDSLSDLPDGAHCDSCNIDFRQDYSKNVELVFHPAAALRPLEEGEYCLMNPMSTPHVLLQLDLEPGARRPVEDLVLPVGRYRLRSLAPGSESDFDYDGERGLSLVFHPQSVGASPRDDEAGIVLENHSDRFVVAVLEMREWRRDALTAHRGTTFQAFRDLFSEEVLSPDDDASIDSVCIMFTDLRGSTALYDRIGDPDAYVLVREHFLILGESVRRHNGSIVKMIGDAVMAVFHDPTDAVQCAQDIHRSIDRFNRESGKSPIVLKIGLHQGRCISVTLNDRLDYYGATANLAARLQGQSQGGDIVLSRSMADDAGVRQFLESLPHESASCRLRGISGEIHYVRIPCLDA